MYSIYKITSPSGKAYIGLTKNKIKERWRQHVKKAFSLKENKPFYNAIRKYGFDKFELEVLATTNTKKDAQKLEIDHIASHGLERLYNISPGGEADGETGSAIFWAKVNENPEYKQEYLSKLSEVKKANDWTDYESLKVLSAAWRKENPKEAYRLSTRAVRIARKTQPSEKVKTERDMKHRLMWKHKRADVLREKATAEWANRTQDDRDAIGVKISRSQKERWAKIEKEEERAKATEAARAAIDRKKQGENASKGLKKFWEDLRKDPEAYEKYINARKETLKNTNERKKANADL